MLKNSHMNKCRQHDRHKHKYIWIYFHFPFSFLLYTFFSSFVLHRWVSKHFAICTFSFFCISVLVFGDSKHWIPKNLWQRFEISVCTVFSFHLFGVLSEKWFYDLPGSKRMKLIENCSTEIAVKVIYFGFASE